MADLIQLRRDTAANWTSANPTLAQGEIGIETDTLKLKIGDGVTAWTSLPYYSTPSTAGTVESVALSVPTGLEVSGSPITTTGTLTITYSTGYSIPTTAKQSQWDTAYSWGNHADAGYLTAESDPIFVGSDVYGVTSADISNWDTAYSWGDHASAGYLDSSDIGVTVLAYNSNLASFLSTFTLPTVDSTANYVLATDGAGNLSFVAQSGGMANPMTTLGDVIVGGASGTPSRLPVGAEGQVLTVVDGEPEWANSASGFSNPMTTKGDIIVGDTGGVAIRLPAGTDGQVLTLAGGVPTWAAPTGGGSSVGVGEIFDWPHASPPPYALVCDGAQVSRTTYAALFAAIGTTWGVGDGSTTFNLPNIPANYTTVQANANVGTTTVGEVIAHSHTYDRLLTPANAYAYGNGQALVGQSTSITGGPANLAAGVRVLKCIRFM